MKLSWSRISRTFAMTFVAAWALTEAAAAAEVAGVLAGEVKHDFEVVDFTAVYYGSSRYPKAPAVCAVDDVWAEIPEYKKILADELDESDPRYHLLLKRATKRFHAALKKLAKRDGYDLIGNIGSVKALGKKKKKIATVTRGLIDLVSRD